MDRNYNDDLMHGFNYQYPNTERNIKDYSSFVFGKNKNAYEDLRMAFLNNLNLDYLKYAMKSNLPVRCHNQVDELIEDLAIEWWKVKKNVLYHNGFPMIPQLPYLSNPIELSFDNNTELERLNGLFIQEHMDLFMKGPRRDKNEYHQYSELYKEMYDDAPGLNYPTLYRDRNAETYGRIIKNPYRNNNKIPMRQIILHSRYYDRDIAETLEQPFERDNLRRKFNMERLRDDRRRHRELLNKYPEINEYQ